MLLKTAPIAIGILFSVPVWATTGATYSVPVPEQLAAYASFQLKDPQVTVKGREIHISYHLPQELVDAKINKVQLEFTATLKSFPEHFTLKGKDEDDYGTCFVNKLGLNCLMSYKFQTDLNQVKKYLKANYPKEFDRRSQVASLFGNEPGGILHIPGNFLP